MLSKTYDQYLKLLQQYCIQEMTQRWAPKKPNFGPPPKGYVAGLGRGATGFVTRGDLGPAARQSAAQNNQTTQVDQANYNQQKFDNWSGYSGALFSKGALDQQDRQAQQAYDFIQRRVFERREMQNKGEKDQQKQQKQDDGSITAKFVDLKRDLGKMSSQQWQAIPDCVDLSIKKRKKDKYTPTPDSLVMNLLSGRGAAKQIAQQDQNLQDFRDAKQILLKSKLDNAQNTISQKQSFDKIGYMTQLNTSKLDAQFLGDIKRARLLLKSALASNPKNPDIWLSAARVQQIDGKLKDCREVLRKAIEACPLSQDLWMELSRMERVEQSQNVLIEGLRSLPGSQKLWLYAARRESQNKQMKSKILRRGLENIPTSVKLWRQLIDMQSVQQAKNLLYKAVESLPKQIDLWLALAKIEDYKNAQKVLNKARKCNPLNLTVWISAARLQQTQAQVQKIIDIDKKIQTILIKSRDVLRKNGANITRDQWLQQAFCAQKSGSMLVSQMLVKISISYGLTPAQLHNVLLKDVRSFQKQKQSNHVTRFLYKYGIQLTKSAQLMRLLIQFQNRKKMRKQHNQLTQALQMSINMFKEDILFWKNVIQKMVKQNNLEAALGLIQQAITEMKMSNMQQNLRLMRVGIYLRSQQIDKARVELRQLVEEFPKGQSVFQSIRFQYQQQNYESAWQLCQKYFRQSKDLQIWRLAFRVKLKIGTYNQALAIIQKASVFFPESILIWQDLIQLQINSKHVSKARAFLDKAMQKNPQNVDLAIMAIQLQRQTGNKKQAAFALSKAMKTFSKNAQIWAIAIQLQPVNTRKKKASSGIQVCGQNIYINASVAKLFWKEGKTDKAKRWLEEALILNPNNGDVWALYIGLLKTNFQAQMEDGLTRFREVQGEMEGRKWKRVVQDKGGWKLSNKEVLDVLMNKVESQIKALD